MKQYDWFGITVLAFLILGVTFIHENQEFSLTLALIGVVYWMAKTFWYGEGMEERRAHRRSRKVYRHIQKRLKEYQKSYDGDDDRHDFLQRIHDQLPELPDELHTPLLVAAGQLYDWEYFDVIEVSKPPPISNSIEGARYRDKMNDLVLRVDNIAHDRALAIKGFVDAYNRFLKIIPFQNTEGELLAYMPLAGLPETPKAIEEMTMTFFSAEYREARIFELLRDRLQSNLEEQNGVFPSEYNGDDLGFAYLKDTPLLDIMNVGVPIHVPENIVFEHTWMMATTGHGKTQAIQFQIASILPKVARGEASLFVMDSQSQMFDIITNLKVFAPGQPLHDKLVLVDPFDDKFPVSANIFDVDIEDMDEGMVSGVIDIYEFFLGSMLADFTNKQTTLFRNLARLLLVIPGASIFTMIEILRDKDAIQKYWDAVEKLPPVNRSFFEHDFPDDKNYKGTRNEINNRLQGIVSNGTIANMFGAEKNKVDLFKEIQAGKVILINTERAFLQPSMSALFGKFYIALLAQATMRRFRLNNPIACHVFIDECQEYFNYANSGDNKIKILLTQARKTNTALWLAHHYPGQLNTDIADTLRNICATRYVGEVETEKRQLASLLRTTEEFLDSQRKLSFATYVRGVTDTAVSVSFEAGLVESIDKMSPSEHDQLIANNRAKYADPVDVVHDRVSKILGSHYEPVDDPPEPDPDPEPKRRPKRGPIDLEPSDPIDVEFTVVETGPAQLTDDSATSPKEWE